MLSRRSTLVRAGLALSVAGVLGACSSGPGTIKQAAVEKKAATQLAAAVSSDVVPNIDCPHDMKAEKGETMDCRLTVDGETGAYAVHVTVASVKDDTYHLTFKVGSTPLAK